MSENDGDDGMGLMQASVAAALSRDVVFGRPAPATYCLASFLTAAALCVPLCSLLLLLCKIMLGVS